jgi:hypothetical protein
MCSNCSDSARTARIRWVSWCCGLLLLAGCSNSGRPLGKLIPVQGKVLVDGTPLSEGEVRFEPLEKGGDFAAKGTIQEDGTYTLTTAGKPGVPAGKYRAIITPGYSTPRAKLLVLPMYQGPRSPLEVEVAENKAAGDYDLNLLPPKRLPVKR